MHMYNSASWWGVSVIELPEAMRQEFTCAMIMKMDCNSRANSNLFPSQNIHLVIFAISLYGFSTLRISRSDVLTIWRRRHERNLSSPYIQVIFLNNGSGWFKVLSKRTSSWPWRLLGRHRRVGGQRPYRLTRLLTAMRAPYRGMFTIEFPSYARRRPL